MVKVHFNLSYTLSTYSFFIISPLLEAVLKFLIQTNVFILIAYNIKISGKHFL